MLATVPQTLDAIPAELRELPQWVVWRFESRDGKRTKVPYRADGSGRASATESASWATFEEAVAASAQADGIGFVFTAEDPFVGIDLDHCFAGDDLLHPDAAAAVLALDSYTEKSVSGDGLHVIARAKLNGSRNRTGSTGWGGSFEVYDAGRFFCITGAHLRGTPAGVEVRQAGLELVLAFMLPPAAASAAGAPVGVEPLDLPDEELLDRARRARNGGCFDALYRGDSSGYPSHSEADLALSGALAFWTGPDPDRIDRLFRASGLMRPKWDSRRGERTYGSETIAAALRGRRDFYRPTAHEPVPESPAAADHDPAKDVGGPPAAISRRVPDPDRRWLPIDLSASELAGASEPPATLGLIYRGKRHGLSGIPEALKTLVSLIVGLTHDRAGHGRFAFVDFEANEASIRLMLDDLRATLDEIRGVYYLAAPESPTAADVAALEAAGVTLVVIDAAAGAYAASGLDDNKRADAERWAQQWVRPLYDHGIATLVLDHVVKDSDKRGRFQIGSERKLGTVDVHLGLEPVRFLTRGGTGLVRVAVHKDRGGHLRRPYTLEIGLVSDPETNHITWQTREPNTADDDTATGDPAWRPTVLMERVSNWLAEQPEPVSRSAVEKAGLGKSASYIRRALDSLVQDGYAEEAAGPRGARLITHLKPFTSSTSSDLVSPRPDEDASTSSDLVPPLQGDGVTDEDEVDELGDEVADEVAPAGGLHRAGDASVEIEVVE